jgi:hypothetical protein
VETTHREFSYSLTFRTRRPPDYNHSSRFGKYHQFLHPPKNTALQPQRLQTTFISFPSVTGRQSLAAIRKSSGLFVPTGTPTVPPNFVQGCGTFVVSPLSHNQDVLGIL